MNDEFPPMLLISEGGCNIKVKAKNAERAGVILAIIVRDNSTSHKDLTQMIYIYL